MKASTLRKIYDERNKLLDPLIEKAVHPNSIDEFEHFLTSPGTLKQPSLILRCRVSEKDIRLKVVCNKTLSLWRISQCFLPFWQRVASKIEGNLDFLILFSDNLYVSETRVDDCIAFMKRVPFLRCDWKPNDPLSKHAIPIPDYAIQQASYRYDLERIERAYQKTPFEQRIPVIKWRGRLSGPTYPNIENIERFARYKLLLASKFAPEVIDASLTTTENFTCDDSGRALEKHINSMFGGIREHQPFEELIAYRYLVSVDGAVSAWKRVPTILASGSVLLLQHQWKQYFYPGLDPWTHYVPLNDDLSDLLSRFDWLNSHPLEARKIAESGRRFARYFLYPESVEQYFVDLINLLAKAYR